MTIEELKTDAWFLERPKVIQEAILKLPPINKYKFKNSGKQCVIYSYEEPHSGLLEDVTVIVAKTGIGGPMDKMGLGILDQNHVFGVKLDDLELWQDE